MTGSTCHVMKPYGPCYDCHTVWLQDVGRVPAVAAKSLRPGDITVWNWGGRARVSEIKRRGAKSLAVTLYSLPAGESNVKVIRSDRLVAKHSRYRRTA